MTHSRRPEGIAITKERTGKGTDREVTQVFAKQGDAKPLYTERKGQDARGKYAARDWSDKASGKIISQCLYENGTVVTTLRDRTGTIVAVHDPAKKLSQYFNEKGEKLTIKDASLPITTQQLAGGDKRILYTDGPLVTTRKNGVEETKFPANDRYGRTSQLRDSDAGTTKTTIKDRIETVYDKPVKSDHFLLNGSKLNKR